ncbi:LPFR motif small protein [Streptomyces cremeus]|uniref:LPFR motif small protein n=1 Tax=Streptomyces cremeus TaxID=66881 RepID=A0ABV5PKW9_STRCM
MFRAVAGALRTVGGAVATVVTLPFRPPAELFGGALGGGRGTRRV